MPGTHIDENILERYAMSVLPPASIPAVEEHLLECSLCQQRLMDAEDFVLHFREAAQHVVLRPAPAPFWSRLQEARRIFWGGGAVLAAACLLVMISGQSSVTKNAPAAVVSLQALRGPEARATMQAGKPGLLVFDVPLSMESGDYAVQIVDATGKKVLGGTAAVKGGELTFAVARLRRADYWVRVFRGSELIAEYGLEAK